MAAPGEMNLEIGFPPSPEFVGVARHVVGALARLRELDPELVEEVKIAVSEACTNAVTVSNRAGAGEPVLVRAQVLDRRVLLSVLDRGAPQEWPRQARSDGTDPDSLDFGFEGGLSLPLLEGLVDELEIVPRDGGGSEVRMTLSAAGGAGA